MLATMNEPSRACQFDRARLTLPVPSSSRHHMLLRGSSDVAAVRVPTSTSVTAATMTTIITFLKGGCAGSMRVLLRAAAARRTACTTLSFSTAFHRSISSCSTSAVLLWAPALKTAQLAGGLS